MSKPQAIRRPVAELLKIQAARRASPPTNLTARDVAGFLACSAFWLLCVYGVAQWAMPGCVD